MVRQLLECGSPLPLCEAGESGSGGKDLVLASWKGGAPFSEPASANLEISALGMKQLSHDVGSYQI
ncbi:MAG TPA: hypothetical protein VK968_03665 [Roseimicrobium sp.]|nr:hypothetical protein [Roseimicrobium sp.]